MNKKGSERIRGRSEKRGRGGVKMIGTKKKTFYALRVFWSFLDFSTLSDTNLQSLTRKRYDKHRVIYQYGSPPGSTGLYCMRIASR